MPLRGAAFPEPLVMTWVIGASSILGYGVMLSDVRVTFSNGQTREMLKKAYPVGPYILAGFAGSVQIGFHLLQSLTDELALPPDAPTNSAWQPEWVANNWGPKAAAIFALSSEQERKVGSQILMVGVSPNENMGVPEIPRVYLIRFSGAKFRPGYMRRGFTVAHIGSGGRVAQYKRAFREHFQLGANMLRTQSGGMGVWASILGGTVDRIVAEHPVTGVSPHVHILACALGEILEGKNDRRTHSIDGSAPIEFKMPPVAANYAEFLAICEDAGLTAEAASA